MFLRPRNLAILGGAALAAGAGVAAYAYLVEPYKIEYVFKDMPIKGLPEHLDGKTLVQISDIHIDLFASPSYIRQHFERVAGFRPDIVVYTGDFVSYPDPTFKRFDQFMPLAPRGEIATLGILGNHDYGWLWQDTTIADEQVERLRALGMTVLLNESTVIEGLQFCGMEDIWSPRVDVSRALATADKDLPTVYLCHNPDGVDLGEWTGHSGWILSGHTHGGQIKPPFLPPLVIPVKNHDYLEGEVDLGDGRILYVSRGMGHALHLRLNVRPEITIFTLKRQQEAK